MAEYIIKIDEALYNEETGEAVFHPTIIGKLIRCNGCTYHEEGVCNLRSNGRVVVMTDDTDFCSDGDPKR